jgi:hypothetical protein
VELKQPGLRISGGRLAGKKINTRKKGLPQLEEQDRDVDEIDGARY